MPKSIPTLLFIALLFTGCGRGQPPPPPPEPVTLTFITLDPESVAEASVIAQFEAEHPHIRVERRGYAQFPLDYLVEEPPPDVMVMGPSNILDSAGKQGLLTDLSDLWTQSDLYATYPENFRKLGEIDGKQYFLPTAYSWAGFYYNRALFAEFDLTPPDTWAELMLIVDRVQANGIIPLALAGGEPFASGLWFDYLNLRLNGSDFHDGLRSGEESYLDQRVRMVFETWALLIANEYFVPGISDRSNLDALVTIIESDNGPPRSHRSAMMLADPLTMAVVPEALAGQLGFFRFPTIDPTLPLGESVLILGYMIPSGAQHVEEALQFVRFMGQPAVQAQLYPPSAENPTYAPVRVADSGEYSDEIRRRMAVVFEADRVHIPHLLGNPLSMESVMESALRNFFDQAEQGAVDFEAITAELEAGREAARAQGEFVQ